MPPAPSSRLAWIDWMRGLACVLMFQTHCYDAWLGGAARKSTFLMWSQLVGTLPAPLFLFLAGISFAYVTDKLIRNNLSAEKIASTMARRGAEVFAFGLLLRMQEYLIAWGWAPWSDLLRVDVLNVIGLSLVCMAAVGGVILRFAPERSRRRALTTAAILTSASISLLSPLLWTTWRPRWLPWPLESYIDGVHNLGLPQPGLFPIFPWMAFAFAGMAAGFVLFSDWAREKSAHVSVLAGAAGIGMIAVAYRLDHLPFQLYSVYDYWHTSPNFFLMRVGMLLAIVFLSDAWCRRGPGTWGFSPLIQLGQTSLLVYWVHIEFVYGRLSILHKRAQGVGSASVGLLAITAMMVVLSLLRTRIDWKAVWASLRRSASEAKPA